MSFKKVSGLDADVTYALGKINKETGKPYPKQAEGYYLGNRTVENKRGESKIHFLQTAKGNLGLWGTTDLNRKMTSVPAGAMTRVTSTGTKPTPKGDMFTYDVEVDMDNTIEVQAQDTSEITSFSEETEADLDGTSAYEDNAADEAAAAELAVQKAAKAKEILARAKKTKSN